MRLEKVTSSKPEPKRRFQDACGLAHAVELLGERWAILVLRELMLGPRRFSDIRADLPGISANVLTQRLTELEQRGLVRRIRLPPPASVHVYEATEWALEANPILCQLAGWAFRSPRHDPKQPVSAVAILLSMQTNFDPALAGDLRCTIGFRFGDAPYYAKVDGGRVVIGAGATDPVDATITCTPNDLKPVLYGGAPPEQLQIDGDVAIGRRFASLFSLPSKVDPGA